MDTFRLSLRQQTILHAVVRDYVITAEPVGSRTLSRKYALGLSAATIRNELADLEEGGLLQQPHTSAGRVPSDRGYRVFVDSLMARESLASEKQAVIDSVQAGCYDLPDLLHQTARLTAVLSGCTAIVRLPRLIGAVIRSISLVPISDVEALLVMVTSSGTVTNRVVNLRSATSTDELALLSNFLTVQLRDRPLNSLTFRALQSITSKMARFQEQLEDLWERLIIQREEDNLLIISNTSALAQQPEFSEGGRVGQLLAFLERPNSLVQTMDRMTGAGSEGEAQVHIGNENPLPDLAECSLIAASYRLDGQPAGEIGILGPTRLDYPAAIAAVEAVAARLTRALATRFST